MPYKNNFGSDQWPEFQSSVNADSVNGSRGTRSLGAIANQITQAQPQSSTDPYSAFRSAAMGWSGAQPGPRVGQMSATQPAASPGGISGPQLAAMLRSNSMIPPENRGDPGGGTVGGPPGTREPVPPPPTRGAGRGRAAGGGNPSTGPDPLANPDIDPGNGYVWNPIDKHWEPDLRPATPPGEQPPPPTEDTPQITPKAPPTYDLPGLIKALQQQLAPQFKYEQDQLARNLAAQGAKTGAIDSGGYGETFGRSMSQLVGDENARLSTATASGYESNLNRALQQYGIDINDRQFWADLALKAKQGDQNAQQFYAWLVTQQFGVSPSQLASIIGGFTPGVVFNPNP